MTLVTEYMAALSLVTKNMIGNWGHDEGTKPSREGYYNKNNPLVEGVPPHIQRPSPARWRPVNMWGHPFYQVIISVVTWVPPHIHRPLIFRCLRAAPHLFLCSSMHWTTVFCIASNWHITLVLNWNITQVTVDMIQVTEDMTLATEDIGLVCIMATH